MFQLSCRLSWKGLSCHHLTALSADPLHDLTLDSPVHLPSQESRTGKTHEVMIVEIGKVLSLFLFQPCSHHYWQPSPWLTNCQYYVLKDPIPHTHDSISSPRVRVQKEHMLLSSLDPFQKLLWKDAVFHFEENLKLVVALTRFGH